MLSERKKDGLVCHDRSPDYGCKPDWDAMGYIVTISDPADARPSMFIVRSKDLRKADLYVVDSYPSLLDTREDADITMDRYRKYAEQFGYTVSPHLRAMKLVARESDEEEVSS